MRRLNDDVRGRNAGGLRHRVPNTTHRVITGIEQIPTNERHPRLVVRNNQSPGEERINDCAVRHRSGPRPVEHAGIRGDVRPRATRLQGNRERLRRLQPRPKSAPIG
jgi:hypothetical protein